MVPKVQNQHDTEIGKEKADALTFREYSIRILEPYHKNFFLIQTVRVSTVDIQRYNNDDADPKVIVFLLNI